MGCERHISVGFENCRSVRAPQARRNGKSNHCIKSTYSGFVVPAALLLKRVPVLSFYVVTWRQGRSVDDAKHLNKHANTKNGGAPHTENVTVPSALTVKCFCPSAEI
jgi:hypothetical protein